MMQAKMIKYDVVGLTETRGKRREVVNTKNLQLVTTYSPTLSSTSLRRTLAQEEPSTVLPALVCASETCTTRKRDEHALNVIERDNARIYLTHACERGPP